MLRVLVSLQLADAQGQQFSLISFFFFLGGGSVSVKFVFLLRWRVRSFCMPEFEEIQVIQNSADRLVTMTKMSISISVLKEFTSASS